jgi:hypothetical protein
MMSPEQEHEPNPEMIELPESTPWPMIAALGLTLVCAGLVTQFAVSVVGMVIALRAAAGWFREVFPESKHQLVPIDARDLSGQTIKTSARTVAHLRAGEADHRVYIPEKFHPYSAGIKGGIAGGFVMAIVACSYGFVVYRSIWYPINLLAAAALPAMTTADLATARFQCHGFHRGPHYARSNLNAGWSALRHHAADVSVAPCCLRGQSYVSNLLVGVNLGNSEAD